MSSKSRLSIIAGTIQSISRPGRWTRTRRRRPISESTRIGIRKGVCLERTRPAWARRRIVADGLGALAGGLTFSPGADLSRFLPLHLALMLLAEPAVVRVLFTLAHGGRPDGRACL